MQEPNSARRLFRNARREALLTLLVWLVALVWTVGYCYLHGYQHDPDSWVVQNGWATSRTKGDFQHFWGIPDWVFIGILLPWLMASAFTVGFCLGMKDDDLGVDTEEGTTHGH